MWKQYECYKEDLLYFLGQSILKNTLIAVLELFIQFQRGICVTFLFESNFSNVKMYLFVSKDLKK